MVVLLTLALVVAFLLVIPLLLIGLALKLVIGLVLLPFRLAGFAIRVAFGLVFGLIFGLVGLIFAGAVLLIPLLPIIALVAGIWLIVRMTRRRPAAPLVTG
jgi:hypothetical protein